MLTEATSTPREREKRARVDSFPQLELGDLVAGKYRIDGVLGEGGMGIVLRATHVDLDRVVAVKTVRPGLAKSQELVSRMLAEAQAAANIRSEHVARVLDVGTLSSGAPYIVLEYLEGRDLGHLVASSGALPHRVAVDFVLQACDAVSEAHLAGIVHRDLKPENLFLTHRADGTPVVKVLDFGISKRLHRSTGVGACTDPSLVVGSPLYMAPEQMDSNADLDSRVDIWALGVVLYELCTGRAPFTGESVPVICGRVLAAEPARPRDLDLSIPEGLEAVILRCLCKKREQRPRNVAELVALLAPFGSARQQSSADAVVIVVPRAQQSSPTLEAEPPSGAAAFSATLLAPLPLARAGSRRHAWKPRATMAGATLALVAVLVEVMATHPRSASGADSHASFELLPASMAASNVSAGGLATNRPSNAAPARAAGTSLKPASSAAAVVDGAGLPKRPRASPSATPKQKSSAWDKRNFGSRL